MSCLDFFFFIFDIDNLFPFSSVYFLISLARGLSIFFSFLKELILGLIGFLFCKRIFIFVSIYYF